MRIRVGHSSLLNVRITPESGPQQLITACRMSAKSQAFPLSALRRALGDDVDDLKRHHYFAGLIDYLDERGDRAAIRL